MSETNKTISKSALIATIPLIQDDILKEKLESLLEEYASLKSEKIPINLDENDVEVIINDLNDKEELNSDGEYDVSELSVKLGSILDEWMNFLE